MNEGLVLVQHNQGVDAAGGDVIDERRQTCCPSKYLTTAPSTRVVDRRSQVAGNESLCDGLLAAIGFVLHMKVTLARLEKFFDDSASRGQVIAQHRGGHQDVFAALSLVDKNMANSHA